MSDWTPCCGFYPDCDCVRSDPDEPYFNNEMCECGECQRCVARQGSQDSWTGGYDREDDDDVPW